MRQGDWQYGCYTCRMALVHEIDPNDIKAVQYLDTGTPGKVSSVQFFMNDGRRPLFSHEYLPLALAMAKDRFPKQEGSTRMSDQPLTEPKQNFVEVMRSCGETKPKGWLENYRSPGWWHGGE